MTAMLAPELAAVVLAHLPLDLLPSSFAVCRTWRQASGDEALWLCVLRRQWAIPAPMDPELLGVAFPDGPRQLVRLFVAMTTRPVWQPPPSEDQLGALERMSGSAHRFLLGIAQGYMPAADGSFTYHCAGATSIHYRHSRADLVGLPPQPYSREGPMRLGGAWLWSPDRTNWFPTTSCEITAGRFGSAGWSLVADNAQLVDFLRRWPLVPLLRGCVPPACCRAGAVARADGLDEKAAADFRLAVGDGPEEEDGEGSPASLPATPCLTLGAFTLHLFFLPPLLVECGERGWALRAERRPSLAASARVPASAAALLEALNAKMVGLGTGTTIRLAAFVRLRELDIRTRLGMPVMSVLSFIRG